MVDNQLLDLARTNYPLVEELYERYLKDPTSISQEWVDVFQALELLPTPKEIPETVSSSISSVPYDMEFRVMALIEAYRTFGHLAASINPLKNEAPKEPMQLVLENFGFSHLDLSKAVPTCGLFEKKTAPLLEVIQTLKSIYCSRIGYEFKGLREKEFERWLQDKIEKTGDDFSLKVEQKQRILEQLSKSEFFETFLHTKYSGQKRFSLEGAETLIPMLSALIEESAGLQTNEFVLGMSHRGRLNVLVNILNKSYKDVFSEFDEGYFPDSFEGTGDVKYHKGFLSEAMTMHGHSVKITLCPNPSHLESVDPVVEGQVKAKQVQLNDEKQEKVQAILVHGDAAIAGQGVVYEVLQMAGLKGYSTGGTIHLVINNQVGFTTSPEEGRSTFYCTDIAKTFGFPVFHVSAEDPEACVYVAILAAQIRQVFHFDVFIDLLCYRKYGHNEGDEPSFTQPLDYLKIRKKTAIREIYRAKLIQEGVVEKLTSEGLETAFKKDLQDALKDLNPIKKESLIESPESFPSLFEPVKTGVSEEILQKCAEKLSEVPSTFALHPKLKHLLKDRLLMGVKHEPLIDWGMGELLAYATLLYEGASLRLSGQDSARGTFSHRHALWIDQVSGKMYSPLSHLKEGQGRVDIINSPLSEYGVLGFEYGYSTIALDGLTIWEAQFGDFSNAAQIIIDQYIAAGEQKWGQKTNLALYLPHGYEGQGPEHSSARLERYLTLAGNDNLIICNPTTPAQFFHLLRRQVKSQWRKPLICLTPKQLLRSADCVSHIEELEEGSFQEILSDKIKNPNQLIFCSGKIFYDLDQVRMKEKMEGLSIIRIEQLYPFHRVALEKIIKAHEAVKDFVWIQEEPANMGAWEYIQPRLQALLPKPSILRYVGRPESGSPASGSYALHKKELVQIFEALTPSLKGLREEL